ncbi:hypothetical protein OE88DRAFT_1738547 [Heliocybe sulcata]|uniref:Uncharacterized protein n=1 Tax=Heliocybe sulcata TaxID=5364 RepID=A0A5C3MRY0_9AGAM|nr:hypothetical protein OE88DRAFT_1738547 [Heliocybe sulcata]
MTPGPSRTTTPEPNPGSSYLERVMAQLSPSSRRRAEDNLIKSLLGSKRRSGNDDDSDSDDKVISSKKPKIQDEVDIDIEMDNIIGWHLRLRDLATNGEYIPLSLFLNDTRRLMLRQHNKVALMTSVREDGKKRQVLDTSKYRDETTLSTEEWQEAMENMVAFALEVLGQERVERWDKHRRWFLLLPMFVKDFEILKQMDIKLRGLYLEWGDGRATFYENSSFFFFGD